MANSLITNLMAFLQKSPTSYHAVTEIAQRLTEKGFEHLAEDQPWQLNAGKSYFTTRNGTLAAWILPKKALKKGQIVASHLDSPTFKLKPQCEVVNEGMVLLGVEVYGSPLLSSWLNRDLGIAGKVVVEGKKGIETHLVNLDQAPVTFAQVAIHLDRTANETGPELQKQEHLFAIAGTASDKEKWLEKQIQKVIGKKKILAHDLYLYPLELPRLLGAQEELLAAYRIDSLSSVHAALTALLANPKPQDHTLQMILFLDHEEVGSTSYQGASSPFLKDLLERLGRFSNRDDWFCFLRNVACLSVDLAHALHPAYAKKHDPQHRPLLNQGIVIKSNAQQRYATDAEGAARVIHLATKHNIPFQRFVSRNDIPSGTTIGPLIAESTGILTIDIGVPQLSMHSCRELQGCHDQDSMTKLLKNWFTNA